MFVLEVLLGLAILAGVAAVAGQWLPGLADESEDGPDTGLPSGRALRSDDVPGLRFRLAWRGYRMADVDAALAALHESLRRAEQRPDPARPRVAEPAPPVEPEPAPPVEPEPAPPVEPAPPSAPPRW